MSSEVRKAGFRVIAIDHEFNRHNPKVSLVVLDLTTARAQGLVERMLYQLKPMSIHLGLPCGTCSRAREKALPAHLRDKYNAPQPLRDSENLLGFQWLQGSDLAKTTSANALYRFAVRLLFICWKLQISPSIENPTRSWLWALLVLLVEELGVTDFTHWFLKLHKTSFHACRMHGSQRNKQTSLLAPTGLYDRLEATCDGQHYHLPWEIRPSGRGLAFATADEAAYPPLLCSRMASMLQVLAETLNITLQKEVSFSRKSKHAMGLQTVSAPPLVPEFSHFHHSEQQCNIDGYRLLASPFPGDVTTDLPADANADTTQDTKRMRKTFKYGVQWEPAEFLEKAKQVQHPKNPHNSLPDVLKEALFQVLTTDPIELAKHRLQVVLAIKRRATELAPQEKILKETMDPILSGVLAPKSLLLWRSLMQETGYRDIAIFDMIKSGMALYGEHDVPDGATLDWRPASSSADELLETSVWRRKAIQGASPDLDHDQQKDLHEASLAEVEKGHLIGPMDEHQVSAALGSSDWLFSPRFAVYQGEEKKVRPIDDCKRSGLNSAYTVNFKLELFDIDSLACLLEAVAESTNRGSYECELHDGSLIGGRLHPSVSSDKWMGRTLDLSRAYKQLGIDEKSRRLSVVGYQHLDTWKYFLNHVLPFGAAASVYSFNRVSKSLHHIICKLLFSLSTCFYDDFPTISPKASASILTKSLSAVLNLLGWDHAQVGSKAIDFASDFAALGITVCLKQLHRGSFVLANKPGRIERICNMLREVINDGFIAKNRASEIQGHLNFAAGFYVSKALQFLVSSFGRLADIPRCLVKGDLNLLCNLTINMLNSLEPRFFRAGSMNDPLLTFTDGAWESGAAGAGAVVYDPSLGRTFSFEIEVPKKLIDLWVAETGEQIISQIEMFALLCVRFKYADRLHNRVGISWIDNESAKYACIKGTSLSHSMLVLCRVLQQIEVEKPSSVWYERVSSHSNPGDMPSRSQNDRASKLFSAQAELSWVPPSELVDAIIMLHEKPYGVVHNLFKGEQTSATNTKQG